MPETQEEIKAKIYDLLIAREALNQKIGEINQEIAKHQMRIKPKVK